MQYIQSSILLTRLSHGPISCLSHYYGRAVVLKNEPCACTAFVCQRIYLFRWNRSDFLFLSFWGCFILNWGVPGVKLGWLCWRKYSWLSLQPLFRFKKVSLNRILASLQKIYLYKVTSHDKVFLEKLKNHQGFYFLCLQKLT